MLYLCFWRVCLVCIGFRLGFTCICIHIIINLSIYVYISICMCIYIYICMYVCVYMYIYMLHACIHAYIIRAYIHTYIHTYTSVCKGIMYTRGPRSPNHIFLQRPRQADAAQRNPGSPYNKQSSRYKVLQNSASTKPFKVLNHVAMLIP